MPSIPRTPEPPPPRPPRVKEEETYADWMVFRDAEGRAFFRVDRHSNVEIAPDCVARMEELLESMLGNPQQMAIVMTARALVIRIQKLETDAMETATDSVS